MYREYLSHIKTSQGSFCVGECYLPDHNIKGSGRKEAFPVFNKKAERLEKEKYPFQSRIFTSPTSPFEKGKHCLLGKCFECFDTHQSPNPKSSYGS
jgi:hypothetical protein